MSESESHEHLSRLAAAGDRAALKALLADTREQLERHLAKKIPSDLRSLVDIEDLIQETHIEVFRYIPSFQPRGPESFYRWLATLAMNRLHTLIRRHRALRRGGGCRQNNANNADQFEDSTIALLDVLAGPGRTPSMSAARVEAIEAVHSALAAIPERYRRAIWLVHIEGRPVREAALEMGRSERSLHGLCRRGLRLLESELRSASRFFSTTG